MLLITANRFLVQESEKGRLSSASLAKVHEAWTSLNRPQVVQFQYDQLTQRELIMSNLKTVQFHGECAQDAVVLNSALHNWKTMAKEMSIRTFCAPDSVIRKWLHDAHKIFEMLGAPLTTFLTFQEMQVKALARMTDEQRTKMGNKTHHLKKDSSGSTDFRNVSGSQGGNDHVSH